MAVTANTHEIFDALVASLEAELGGPELALPADQGAKAPFAVRITTDADTGLEIHTCASQGCERCRLELDRPVYQL